MGTCSLNGRDSSAYISIKDFKFKDTIGVGGYGKVWRVQRRSDSKVFALKALSKARILYKNSIYSIMNERLLLSHMNHP